MGDDQNAAHSSGMEAQTWDHTSPTPYDEFLKSCVMTDLPVTPESTTEALRSALVMVAVDYGMTLDAASRFAEATIGSSRGGATFVVPRDTSDGLWVRLTVAD